MNGFLMLIVLAGVAFATLTWHTPMALAYLEATLNARREALRVYRQSKHVKWQVLKSEVASK